MKKKLVSQDEIIEAVRHHGLRSFDKLRKPFIRRDEIPHKGETSVVFRTAGRLDTEFEYGMAKIYMDEDIKRKRHYDGIIPRLKEPASPHLLSVQYYGKDFLIFGKDGEPLHLPVLAMAWAGGGCTIDEFVKRHLHEKTVLEALLYQFAQLCIWLGEQSFTHGNLRSDNIMYQRHAPLALVDYDTLRFKDQEKYNPFVDHCNIAAIGLSLCLVCADWNLWERYYKPEDGLLLFSKVECRKGVGNLPQLDEIRLLKDSYPLLAHYERLFRTTMHNRKINGYGMEALISTPERLFTDGNTDSTYKDLILSDVREPWVDGYVCYSYDKAYLLSDNGFCIPEYKVKEGTLVICDLAFTDSRIRKLTLPYSLKYIGFGAFSYSKIEEIVCHSPCFRVEHGAVYTADMTRLVSCFTHDREFTVSSSVREIAPGAFYCNGHVEKVMLPDGITSIQEGTFDGCEALKKIRLPDSVVEIGKEAFYRTKNLTHIELTNVTAFGKSCFYESGLESVRIADGTEEIPEEAFSACLKLKDVTFPGTLKTIGKYAFGNCVELSSVALPDSLGSIESYAFFHCKSLETVLFPKNPPVVSDTAFEETPVKDYPRQDDEKEPDDGPEWEYNADRTMLIRCRSKAETLVIEEPVRIIGERALCCLPARHILLPDSLRCIRENAFAGCKNLEAVHIPEGVVSIEEDAFSGCSTLKKVKTPSSLLRLGARAFEECISLRLAIIAGKMTTIGQDTFLGCCFLKRVVFPRTLEHITDGPFERCFSLRSVRLPFHAKMNLYIFPDGCKISFYPPYDDDLFQYELTKLSRGFLNGDEDIWVLSPVVGRSLSAKITPYVVIEGFEQDNLHISIAERPVFLNRKEAQPKIGTDTKTMRRIMNWVREHRLELLEVWKGTETAAAFRKRLNPVREKELLRKKDIDEFPDFNEDDF